MKPYSFSNFLLCALIAYSANVGICGQDFTNSGETRKSLLVKRTLSFPSSVENLIYERVLLREKDEPAVKELIGPDGNTVTLRKKRNDLFLVRWQANGFLLVNFEEKAVVENLELIYPTNYITISGYFQDRIWSLEPPALGTIKRPDGELEHKLIPAQLVFFGTKTEQGTHSYRGKVLADEKQALEAVQLGFHDLKPGSVRWEGNELVGITSDGRRIQGLLSLDAEKNPIEIRYSVENGSKYILNFTYSGEILDALDRPSLIRRTADQPGNGPERMNDVEMRILSYKTVDGPLPEGLFLPGQFTKSDKVSTLVYTNGTPYVIQDKKLVPFGEHGVPLGKRMLYLGFLAFIIVVPPIMLLVWRFVTNRKEA
jgi:hypothetical protein